MVNYSATSNNMKLVHWPLMVGLLHWYSEEGSGGLRLLTVPNVTVRPSTASVSFNVLLYSHYSGPFRDFNVPVHNFGDRCFAAAGPRLWNTLPLNLRLCDSLGQLKRSLKTLCLGCETTAPCDTSFKARRIEISLLTYLKGYVTRPVQPLYGPDDT